MNTDLPIHFRSIMRYLALITVLLTLSNAFAQGVAGKSAKDEIPMTRIDDQNMAAAIEKARSTLDGFLSITRNPSASYSYKSVAVKVAVTDSGNTEHFWITPFFEKDGQFFGAISNPPRLVTNVKMGKPMQFPRSDIIDWMYIDGASQRMHGNFTACVMLKKEPPGEAEKLKRKLGLNCDG